MIILFSFCFYMLHHERYDFIKLVQIGTYQSAQQPGHG